MKYILYNEKREIVQENEDGLKVITMLTSELFNRYIAKTKDVKQLQYQYNYTDTQKITIIYKNGWRAIYEGIPTKMGLLDNYKIAFNIKNK